MNLLDRVRRATGTPEFNAAMGDLFKFIHAYDYAIDIYGYTIELLGDSDRDFTAQLERSIKRCQSLDGKRRAHAKHTLFFEAQLRRDLGHLLFALRLYRLASREYSLARDHLSAAGELVEALLIQCHLAHISIRRHNLHDAWALLCRTEIGLDLLQATPAQRLTFLLDLVGYIDEIKFPEDLLWPRVEAILAILATTSATPRQYRRFEAIYRRHPELAPAVR